MSGSILIDEIVISDRNGNFRVFESFDDTTNWQVIRNTPGASYDGIRQSEEILSNSKIKIKTKYRSWRNNNHLDAAFTDVFLKMFPEGHPYRIGPWGIMEQVDTLSIHTCQNYYNTYFSPNNAALIIVGDIVPEDVTKLIYQYFSELTPTQDTPPDPDLSMNDIPDKVISANVSYPQEPIYFSIVGVNTHPSGVVIVSPG